MVNEAGAGGFQPSKPTVGNVIREGQQQAQQAQQTRNAEVVRAAVQQYGTPVDSSHFSRHQQKFGEMSATLQHPSGNPFKNERSDDLYKRAASKSNPFAKKADAALMELVSLDSPPVEDLAARYQMAENPFAVSTAN